jgi:hypothetical protein
VFFPSGSIKKYQIKSSRGYYTQHREVTGAAQGAGDLTFRKLQACDNKKLVSSDATGVYSPSNVFVFEALSIY